ncbi:Lipid A biosynthesis lauroyl acyltransferase [hydrothermal vent metagenome]|uniref:Lipid A biosynthesis lauroyl acyltransferase n=1 Tax=hydrothermal vent metagenome TaxID=652676 RepID=A0A3B1B0X5_9ZZZZ
MLSPRGAQLVGGAIGRLFVWLPNREQRASRININLCFPELNEDEKRHLLRHSLIESAKALAEMPGFWQGNIDRWLPLVRDQQGRAIVDELLARGKGVIVAGPHLGSWEAVGLALAGLAPVTTLYRPPRYEALADMIFNGRSRTGARLVATDASGIKALYKTLKTGGMVAILPDQQPKSARGAVFAPFFGVPALTMELVSRLSKKTRAPVVFCFAERLPKGQGFRLHWVPAPDGIDDPDPELAAAALNKGVETCVRICPEQYQWSYKRFRSHPDGKTNRYAAESKKCLSN